MARGSGGCHPIKFETMPYNASDGAYIDVRIRPAHARDALRVRLTFPRPPNYDAAVDDEFVLHTGETEVNDVGICHEFAVVNEPLTDECVTQKSS